MSDCATIISAVITGSATIIAFVIAWFLTKRGLNKYQQYQDLKKTEVRLLRNIFDTKTKLVESFLLMVVSTKIGEMISIQEKKEEFFKFYNSYSGFELLLEEIRTELSMTTSTHKNYMEEMGESVDGILQFILSPLEEDWYKKMNPYMDNLNSIFYKLVQFIHKKIKAKLKELD